MSKHESRGLARSNRLFVSCCCFCFIDVVGNGIDMSIYTKILIKARKTIESGRRIHICHAIENQQTHFCERLEVRRWIHRLLDGRGTYEMWLCHERSRTFSKMRLTDFRAGRLQWLDWMIVNVDKEILK